jgi:hypothetical protein
MKRYILFLVLLLVVTLGADAIKVLISDTDQTHANTCSTYVQAHCPTADITIRLEALSSSVDYAIANGYDIISRSSTGLRDYYQTSYGSPCYDEGIGIVMAHGSNSRVELGETSHIGYIIAVGAGTEGVSTASYGHGLEFYVNGYTHESWTTAIIAGMIAQLITDHDWTFNQARQALRQTASGWEAGWNKEEGFGYVDYAAADSLETAELYNINTVSKISITKSYNYLEINWNDPMSEQWTISCDYYPVLDSIMTNNYYIKSHSINDAVTIVILPDSSRAETYSTKTTNIGATQEGGSSQGDGYVIYLPSSDEVVSGWNTTGINYYTEVDELELDEDDYIYATYSQANFGISCDTIYVNSNIDSVKIYAFVAITAMQQDAIAVIGVNIEDTDYLGTTKVGDVLGGFTCDYKGEVEYTYYVSPATSLVWSWDEINNMELYIDIDASIGGKLFMANVIVYYSNTLTQNLILHKISGSSNVGKINNIETANIKSYMGVSLQ